VIHLDTSFLIRAGVPDSIEGRRLRTWFARREAVRLSAVVWAEFACGPVSPDAMDMTGELFGKPEALGGLEATIAAQLFNASGRRRGSLADCMIAAIAIKAGAALATSNRADFERFVPLGLVLATA
jgi:predicted nucleic acid-binding protein